MVNRIKEFGDFQTPDNLAEEILNYLVCEGVSPLTVIEPTCGEGSFIRSALNAFPNAKIIARDINTEYIEKLHSKLKGEMRVDLRVGDFFKISWDKMIEKAEKPVLVVGNPPWVTAADLSVLGGTNIPKKSNFAGYEGLDAVTGRSNFDISEWMSIELLKALSGKHGTFAMVCKASVARRIFEFVAKIPISVQSSTFCLIDVKRYFNVSTVAGVFICTFKPNSRVRTCRVVSGLANGDLVQEIGYIDDQIIADISLYHKWEHLRGDCKYKWRSGIKHDCAKVMELDSHHGRLINKLGEEVEIEDTYLFPMLKSSDVANNRIASTNKFMLVPQTFIGEDTKKIADTAPLTWQYLLAHKEHLENRKSRIYRDRPQFAIFGVGKYSFSPWKIAISGFYKHLTFQLIRSLHSKPVVFDDTCYFLPAHTHEEAAVLYYLYSHSIAKEFYLSLIFWDSKRPIKKDILQRLAVRKLVHEIGFDVVLRDIKAKFPALDQRKIREELLRITTKNIAST